MAPLPTFEASERVVGPMSERLAGSSAKISSGREIRVVISATLLVVDVLLLALVLSDTVGPWRFVFGMVFAITTPGWSLVGLLQLRNGALEIGLSLALSVALVMICAQVMMTLQLWHPVALEELMCVACAPSLVLQSKALQWVANHLR